MTPVRIGIVGLGKIAADQHIPAIADNPSFTLAATVSRSGARSSINFTSHEAMLSSAGRIDAVAIATPPGPRYAIARDCIEAGLHVLLEKPPTVTLGEIDHLIELARERGVSLFATWHSQHNPAVVAAARLLEGKRVKEMTIVWHEDVEKWHPGQRWIWEPGGFGVFDPGINAFSIASAVFPDALFVREAKLSYRSASHTPIAAEIVFGSPASDEPLRCSLDWRMSAGEEWTILIRTEEGVTVELLEGGSRLVVDSVVQEMPGRAEYPAIYRRFAALIADGESEVDTVPLRLVADCMLVGSRTVLDED